jgi:superfamily II DNA or RNA helicase
MPEIKLEYTPRPQQDEILDFVKTSVGADKKFIMIDAPTGCLTKNEKVRIYKLKK